MGNTPKRVVKERPHVTRPRTAKAKKPLARTAQSRRRARKSAASISHEPTDLETAGAKLILQPWEWLTAPKFYGLKHVPTDRPFLLVGNHTLMGVLDVPLMVLGLHEQRGVFVHALGDHMHFQIPLWRDLLSRFGTVDGTRDNCRALMRSGESILVFPGGGREVFKRKGEKYHLLWKKRIGFARLAIEHGYPIVPFAAVGAEECYDIVVDGNDLLDTPLRAAIEWLSPRPDVIPPLVRGIGLSPVPRPQRFYFRFGAPIETTHLAGRARDQAACFALREEVRHAVQRGIAALRAARRRDPDRDLGARVVHSVQRRLSAAVSKAPRRRRAAQARSTSTNSLR